LLVKVGRRLAFTPTGVELVAGSRRLLDDASSLADQLGRTSAGVSGTVVVAAFPTAARTILPAAITRLAIEHPAVEIRLIETEPEQGIAMLLRGDVDITISNDWADAPEIDHRLVSTPLLDDPVIAAVPASHRLATRRRVDLADFAGERLIAWPHGTLCRRWLADTMRQRGIELTIVHSVAEHATQLALVAAGQGIAVLPSLGTDTNHDGIGLLELRDPLRRHIHTLTRHHAADHPTIKATRAALVHCASG
jgi:DNA-binding transcriptional LysR family regulator